VWSASGSFGCDHSDAEASLSAVAVVLRREGVVGLGTEEGEGGGSTCGVVDVLEGCDSDLCNESDLCRVAGGGFSGETPEVCGRLPCESEALSWLPCEPGGAVLVFAELTLAELPKGAKKPGDSGGREEQMETATFVISM
jgi:hypothetical protein